MNPPLRVEVTRAQWVESWHEGLAVLVDAKGQIPEAFGEDVSVFARSSLKPFQAFPLLATGAIERLRLSQEELAIAVSSHSGTERHVSLARSILDKAHVDVACLRCGPHPPLHDPSAEAMLCRGEKPTALHNNCSGKHAAMLAVCQDQGWDLETYDRLDHPLQRMICATLARVTGIPEASIEAGVDGCGVPAWRLPLSAQARALAHLAQDAAFARIVEAMCSHPELVAGEGRFDTLLMKACPHLVAKAGAEAVHVGADCRSGLAWAVKIADGNRRAIPPVVLKLLERHGVIPAGTLPELAEPFIYNRRGERVGSIRVQA